MSIGIRTPGPIDLFARARGQSIGYYLGTCVAAPEPEFEKYKIPVMNDLGGRSVPFQLVQDGETATVYATLNRFDYSLLQSLRALESGTPFGGTAGNLAVGSETGIARGTLNIGITDWELITTNSYFGTSSAGQFVGPSDLIAGRRYASCNIRKYKESTEGTRVLEVALAIDCQNVFSQFSILGFVFPSARGFALFTEDPSQLGTISSTA